MMFSHLYYIYSSIYVAMYKSSWGKKKVGGGGAPLFRELTENMGICIIT